MARNIEDLVAPLYFGSNENRVKIDVDGSVSLEGSATGYISIPGNIGASNIMGSAGTATFNQAEALNVFAVSGDIATDADVVAVKFPLPNQTKTASTAKLRVHWMQPSDGAYEFSWKYRVFGAGRGSITSWSTAEVVPVSGTSNVFAYDDEVHTNLDQITKLGEIDITNFDLGSIIQVKFTRSDEVIGSIYVHDLSLQFEIDQPAGSKAEYEK